MSLVFLSEFEKQVTTYHNAGQRKRPDYEAAHAAEVAAVRAGDFNFKGVGL